jgi:hypothetical protein
VRRKEAPPPAEGFDEFWAAYPRRKDKKQAVKAWNALQPSAELRTKLLAAIERCKRTEWFEAQYTPYPATWINRERWTDEADVKLVKKPAVQRDLSGSHREYCSRCDDTHDIPPAEFHRQLNAGAA